VKAEKYPNHRTQRSKWQLDTKHTTLQIQKQKLELKRRNADYKASHIRWQHIFDYLSGPSNEKRA
jgi:hypothetical protein